MRPNEDMNASESKKREVLRSRTKTQPTNERRNLLRGMTSKTIAMILLQHPTSRLSLHEFYTAFGKLASRGTIGKRSESSIRGVLSRFRDEGIVETNPEARLPARYRVYWLTEYGYQNLNCEFGSESTETLSSQDGWDLGILPRSPSTGRAENRQVTPRFITLNDVLDLRAARFERVNIKCRIDLHIGRVIHAASEKQPAVRDRSQQATHSEESYTLTITHRGWLRMHLKRPDWPKKLIEWMESINIPSADIVHVWTDIWNQVQNIDSILEIPAKTRLPDGDHRFLELREVDPQTSEVLRRRQIEYVRSHDGEIEVRGKMGDLHDFMTVFLGTAAGVWPEFSDLRESIKEEIQSLKENLDKEVLEQLQKQQAEINRLQMIVEKLVGTAPQQKEESDERRPDYYG